MTNWQKEDRNFKVFMRLFWVAIIAFFVWAGVSIYQQETARARGIQIGEIYAKKLSPAQVIVVGETTTHIPETYYIYIQNDGRTNWFGVRQESYYDAQIGDTFSSKCYCITQRKK